MTPGSILDAILRAILGPLKQPKSRAELDSYLDGLNTGRHLNWRTSIVDLLKLIGEDSSLAARKRLAQDLGYTGSAADGSAEKNIWLHTEVMWKLSNE